MLFLVSASSTLDGSAERVQDSKSFNPSLEREKQNDQDGLSSYGSLGKILFKSTPDVGAYLPSHFQPEIIPVFGSDSATARGDKNISSGSKINLTEVEETEEIEKEEKEVCFPVVGCFDMKSPWRTTLRPILKPFPPEKIEASVFFFSRPIIDFRRNITLYPHIDMKAAPFDPRKVTVIMVHGFCSSGNSTWLNNLKDAYLKNIDANIMIVDWEKGANLLNYLQVAGNTRVVGKELVLLVNYLIQNYGADPKRFHLIGHSLGAQICSYLAKEIPGIARLTALDPAQPGFEGFDKLVRLDESDADFVDVVHTSAKPFIPTLGLGMIAPHGHVDFYFNGGFNQPGCALPPKEDLPIITSLTDLLKFPVEVLSNAVSCPHSRANEYLIEALNNTQDCIFWGRKADISNILKAAANTVTQGAFRSWVAPSESCNYTNCIPLGLRTKRSPLRGSFVVTTMAKAPFCIHEMETESQALEGQYENPEGRAEITPKEHSSDRPERESPKEDQSFKDKVSTFFKSIKKKLSF